MHYFTPLIVLLVFMYNPASSVNAANLQQTAKLVVPSEQPIPAGSKGKVAANAQSAAYATEQDSAKAEERRMTFWAIRIVLGAVTVITAFLYFRSA